MKGKSAMTMNTLCKKIKGFRKSVSKIAKKYEVNIYLDDITDEDENPIAPNIVFGYSGTDEKKNTDFNWAFEDLQKILILNGFVMYYECNGDGDNEILMSYRVS